MSLIEKTCICIIATCDRCGREQQQSDWEFTVHYESRAEARKDLENDGWTFRLDGLHELLLCEDCTEETARQLIEGMETGL